MSLDLAIWLTFISSNSPCLEHIFILSKVFEPLRFYCLDGIDNIIGHYQTASIWSDFDLKSLLRLISPNIHNFRGYSIIGMFEKQN